MIGHLHDWEVYDPPHWRYCKICGREEAKRSPFDDFEFIRVNKKLIQKRDGETE